MIVLSCQVLFSLVHTIKSWLYPWLRHMMFRQVHLGVSLCESLLTTGLVAGSALLNRHILITIPLILSKLRLRMIAVTVGSELCALASFLCTLIGVHVLCKVLLDIRIVRTVFPPHSYTTKWARVSIIANLRDVAGGCRRCGSIVTILTIGGLGPGYDAPGQERIFVWHLILFERWVV